jgi:hypothetical protein
MKIDVAIAMISPMVSPEPATMDVLKSASPRTMAM